MMVRFKHILIINSFAHIKFSEYSCNSQPICEHLPLQHHVVFIRSESHSYILWRLRINKIMLTKWFEQNKNDIEATSLYYS